MARARIFQLVIILAIVNLTMFIGYFGFIKLSSSRTKTTDSNYHPNNMTSNIQLGKNSTDLLTSSSSSGQLDEKAPHSVSKIDKDNAAIPLQTSSPQPDCVPSSENKGAIVFNLENEQREWTLDSVAAKNKDIQLGGSWAPVGCRAQSRLLVVIPYRDRAAHLIILLGHLLPLLKEQMISYTVYLVEQVGNYTFNKGRIMNAAFKEATSKQKFDCVIFHDVDLIPEDNRIPYSCPNRPMHLSIAIDKFQYILPYVGLVGGVFLLRTEHFEKVNGYPSYFWGWGGEDDDMYNRLLLNNLNVIRPSVDIGRYKMISHGQRLWNEESPKLLEQTQQRWSSEGLRSTNFHAVLSVKKMPLFTHMLVDVGTENQLPDARNTVLKS